MKSVLLSLVPFLLFVIGAEVAYRHTDLHDALQSEKRYTALVHHFHTAVEAPPDVVVFGDSRTIHGVDPRVVEALVESTTGEEIEMFNFGLPGAPPLTHLALVDHVLTRDPPPRLVIIHLSPYMFSTGIEPTLSREAISSTFTVAGAFHALRAGMPIDDVASILPNATFDLMRHRRRILAVLRSGREPRRAAHLRDDGHGTMPGVHVRTQRMRARQRAGGYLRESRRPENSFNWEMYRYLRRTVERLTDTGVEVALVTTPASSPLLENDGEHTTYAEYRRRIEELAHSLGVPFFDHRYDRVLPDYEYVDGDHPNQSGARRYSAHLALDVVLPILAPESRLPEGRWFARRPSPGCTLIEDFEDRSLEGWQRRGEAFRPGLHAGAVGAMRHAHGMRGVQVLNTYHPMQGDRAVGVAVSPPFTIDHEQIHLLVAGGDLERLRVELVVDGRVRHVARGQRNRRLQKVRWPVRDLVGRQARVRIVDQARGPWGHLLVDQIESCDPSLGQSANGR